MIKQFNSEEKRHSVLLRLPMSLYRWVARRAKSRKQSITATIIEILMKEKDSE